MIVTETFFTIDVNDVQRAAKFYVEGLGATIILASDASCSLLIAGVRVGLLLSAEHQPCKVGLRFVVQDLAAANAAIKRAGGIIVTPVMEVTPGMLVALVTDTEGNGFTLRQA